MDSSFSTSYFSKAKLKLASFNHGDGDFMKWMSSTNPMLLSKYSTLSKESQTKLRSLFTLSQQTITAVDEVLKSVNRCEQEFVALDQKIANHLDHLGCGDVDSFSCETLKAIHDSATVIEEGKIGDGTELGSAASMARDFLAETQTARQKLSLKRDIMLLKKRNERLKENLHYYQRECRVASEEVTSMQSLLRTSSIDLSLSAQKLDKPFSLTRIELNECGISPATSYQAILDSYNGYRSLLSKIVLFERKLEQYGELPPNIHEAEKIVHSNKLHLNSLSDELKLKLTAFHTKRF